MLKLTSVTNIFIYSRLNPLITVHQISQEFPLSWLDTPFQLHLPRYDSNLPPSGPNLGLVVIPSDIVLNGESFTESQETTFATYRLQRDLSIVGDMYGTQESEIHSFSSRQLVKRTETLSQHWTTTDADSEVEEKWTPFRSNWKVNFSSIADEVIGCQLPRTEISNERNALRQLKDEIVEKVESSETQFDTMYLASRLV
jgi:hypothetical protein